MPTVDYMDCFPTGPGTSAGQYMRKFWHPALPRFPDFEKDGLWVETYTRPCNFLKNIENDPVHIPFTHRESEFFLRRPREIPADAQEETEWGLMPTTTSTGRVQYLHYGMPNILGFKESDRDHLAFGGTRDELFLGRQAGVPHGEAFFHDE